MLTVTVINNQSIIPSPDVIQLTLTLKMTTAQVVETSVTVNNNNVHPDDQTQPTFEMTPGFKPFTVLKQKCFKTSYIAVLIKILLEFDRFFKLQNVVKSRIQLITRCINFFRGRWAHKLGWVVGETYNRKFTGTSSLRS